MPTTSTDEIRFLAFVKENPELAAEWCSRLQECRKINDAFADVLQTIADVGETAGGTYCADIAASVLGAMEREEE